MKSQFKIIGITDITIRRILESRNYGALALYTAYFEVAEWQKTYKVKATNSFMMKRLNMGEIVFSKAKKVLLDLGIIENIQVHKQGKSGSDNYVQINHLIPDHYPDNTPPDTYPDGNQGSSAYNNQLSAYNSNNNAPSGAYPLKATKVASFDLEKSLEKLETTPNSWEDHIASYIRCKGLKLANSEQLVSIKKRLSKPAKELQGWDSDAVYDTMKLLERRYQHELNQKGELNAVNWGMETILKTLIK